VTTDSIVDEEKSGWREVGCDTVERAAGTSDEHQPYLELGLREEEYFQILCEAHLLPGALTRNDHLLFRNRDQRLRIRSTGSAWTNEFTVGQEIVIPVKNGEGRYVADTRTLDQLEAEDRIVARYAGENPNGSMRDIAAIRNEAGNVVGIMPHPEHAIDELTGPSQDGLRFITSLLKHLAGVRLQGVAA
jgi:phosphoribosylformylglycinamidine synthase